MNILVAGDWHGDLKWATNFAIPKAHQNKAKTIFHVGDFGYWEHTKKGELFLDNLSATLVGADVRLVFLLGNHENWELIENYRSADKTTEGFHKIRENLYWVPCGTQWSWSGVRFGAVGGAFSIDRSSRVLSESYWEQEIIDDEKASDIIDATGPCTVDIMFAHDAPSYVDMFYHMWQKKGRRIIASNDSLASRSHLQKIVNHWKPNTFIHGHWHLPYVDKVDDVNYVGLDCEGTGDDNICILHLNKGEASITIPSAILSKKLIGV